MPTLSGAPFSEGRSNWLHCRLAHFIARNLPAVTADEDSFQTGVQAWSGLEMRICLRSFRHFFVARGEDWFARRSGKRLFPDNQAKARFEGWLLGKLLATPSEPAPPGDEPKAAEPPAPTPPPKPVDEGVPAPADVPIKEDAVKMEEEAGVIEIPSGPDAMDTS